MQDQQFEFVGSVAKPSTTAEDIVHCQACHLNAVGLWQGMESLARHGDPTKCSHYLQII